MWQTLWVNWTFLAALSTYTCRWDSLSMTQCSRTYITPHMPISKWKLYFSGSRICKLSSSVLKFMVCIYKNAFITYWDVIPKPCSWLGPQLWSSSQPLDRPTPSGPSTLTCWPMASSHQRGHTGATLRVLDDYAMTTTTSDMQLPVLCKFALSLPCIPLCPYPLDETLQFSSCMHRIGWIPTSMSGPGAPIGDLRCAGLCMLSLRCEFRSVAGLQGWAEGRHSAPNVSQAPNLPLYGMHSADYDYAVARCPSVSRTPVFCRNGYNASSNFFTIG